MPEPTPELTHADADLVSVSGGGCVASAPRAYADCVGALLAMRTPTSGAGAGESEAWPPLEEVKRSTVRTVLRGRVPGALDVHVKLYRAVRWTDQARDLLQGTRARVEFTNLRRARALDLPAAEPIAFGATSDVSARSFLVTRTIAGQPLPRGPLPATEAAALGVLLRSVHDRGVETFDLHPENVLRDARGQHWLVDLTNARFGEALDLRQRAHALAFFLLDVDGGPAHAAAAPLMNAYRASPALHAAAQQAWHRLRRRALAAFGRRATRACKHTAVDASAGAHIYRHLPSGDLADWAVAIEPTLATHEPTKSGRRGAVWVLDAVVAKRRPRSTARELFRAAYWLTYAEVACARPLALVLRHDGGVVLSQRVPALDLAQRVARGELSTSEATAAARSLGESVGRLHAHGLRNRDLKLENLVVDPRTGAVVMVDLDGVRRRSPTDQRGQAADLGRLLAAFRLADAPGGTATLRAFLRTYYRARQCLGHLHRSPRAGRFQRRRIAARARGRLHRGHSPPPDCA